jgi:hypothetical protein
LHWILALRAKHGLPRGDVTKHNVNENEVEIEV